MNQTRAKTVLSIESAILGGSVALSTPNGEVRSSLGTTGVSRAEDLLINTKLLLEESSINTSDIDGIVVSIGPGSFTGIRIGVATAKGLATALDIEVNAVSLLASMACVSGIIGIVAACVPVGRGMFCGEIFEVTEIKMVTLVAAEPIPGVELQNWLRTNNIRQIAGVREHFIDTFDLTDHQFIEVNACLAEVILAASLDARIETNVEPIFISKSSSV